MFVLIAIYLFSFITIWQSIEETNLVIVDQQLLILIQDVSEKKTKKTLNCDGMNVQKGYYLYFTVINHVK